MTVSKNDVLMKQWSYIWTLMRGILSRHLRAGEICQGLFPGGGGDWREQELMSCVFKDE